LADFLKSSPLKPLGQMNRTLVGSIYGRSGFRGEEFLKSAIQKRESHVAVMFVNGSGRNEQSLQRTFHRCFLPSLCSIGYAVSEEKIFNWQTWPPQAILVYDWSISKKLLLLSRFAKWTEIW
jgi:hypothetical protein